MEAANDIEEEQQQLHEILSVDEIELLNELEQQDQLRQMELYQILQQDHVELQNRELEQLQSIGFERQDVDDHAPLEFLPVEQQYEQLRQLEHYQLLRQERDELEELELLRQQDELYQFLEQERGDVQHDELLDQLQEQMQQLDRYRNAQRTRDQQSPRSVPLQLGIRQKSAVNTNNSRSFKGRILNPSQDEDDVNSLTSATDLNSDTSNRSSTILSADFGDDDVLPIEETSCVICCIEYQNGDEILRNAASSYTPSMCCNHIFHVECITSWIQTSRKAECPCCRSPFALSRST
jgi:Ring finger domain